MASARYDNTDGRLRGSRLQKRRLKKWTEAIGRCAWCGTQTEYADPRVNPRGFHLDHIEMLEKSKNDSEENTQVLCFDCHDKKTQKDMGHADRLKFKPDGRVDW